MPQTETVGDEDADVFVDIGALFHLARRSEVVGPEVVSAWLDGDDALDDLTVERAGKPATCSSWESGRRQHTAADADGEPAVSLLGRTRPVVPTKDCGAHSCARKPFHNRLRVTALGGRAVMFPGIQSNEVPKIPL